MIKRGLLFGLGFLSFCFPVSAQQSLDTASPFALYSPEIFSTADSLALIEDLPVLTLLDEQRLPVWSELGRMGRGPLDIFPDVSLIVAEVQKVNTVPASARMDGKDSASEVTRSPLNPIYVGGEMGVLYGSSSGKFGGEILQTYIVGEVGNEYFHITIGALHEESSGRSLRLRSGGPLGR